jgi:ATP-dependent Clp protease ATP-binding subunit ClpC
LAKGSFADVLLKMKVDSEKVRTEVERIVSPILIHAGTPEIPLTPRARKAIKIAAREARKSKHDRIGAEHVFLGLLVEGSGVAALALRRIGVRTDEVREAISELRVG